MAAGYGYYSKRIPEIHRIPYLFYAEVYVQGGLGRLYLFLNGEKRLPEMESSDYQNISIVDGELQFNFAGEETTYEHEYPVKYLAIMDAPS